VRLAGPRVVLRSASGADAPRLTSIRAEPEVERRWGILEDGEMDEFVRDDKTFVIEVDGEIVGAVQYGEVEDPMYRSASIDLYVTTPWHGHGLGSEAVRILAWHLIKDRGHHRLTIDPAADNVAAIRAYEKAGFRPVGVMRSYERGPDGTWHDGLLMELLAEEFVPDPPD
jgi:aminoglycoside 6'-N-acetyltransferase